MVRLDLGGTGQNGQWITVNSDTSGYRPAPDIVADISAHAAELGDHFRAQSVDEIRCIHTLEHLPAWDILPTLVYWRTLLRPGGRLFLVVPDIGAMAIHYADGAIPFDVLAAVSYVSGFRTVKGPGEEHRWAWDERSLKADLERAGYHDAIAWLGWPESWLFDYPDMLHTGAVGCYQVPNLRVEARS